MRESQQQILRFLAQRTGTHPDEWALVHRARYGMEVLFRELVKAAGPGEVLTQSYTCVTAINPILAAGLTPRYGEISPDTVALDPAKLRLDEKTRAVILQHTFGIISDTAAAQITRQAHESGVLVIEDAAHCLTRMARGSTGEPLADVSIHSFGADKLLPTQFGAAIWVNPKARRLAQPIGQATLRCLSQLPEPGRLTRIGIATYRAQIAVLNRVPNRLTFPLRDLLLKAGLFLPPVCPGEKTGQQPEEPWACTVGLERKIVKKLDGFEENLQQRRTATASYLAGLCELVQAGRLQIPAAITPDMPLVRFPVFVPVSAGRLIKDPEEIFAALAHEKLRPGRWYRPALFPGVDDPARYHYDQWAPDQRITNQLMAGALNLPTDVDEDHTQQVIGILKRHLT